jgi:hypothetical protein
MLGLIRIVRCPWVGSSLLLLLMVLMVLVLWWGGELGVGCVLAWLGSRVGCASSVVLVMGVGWVWLR